MIFEPIIITEDQNLFELHLRDFLLYKWPGTIFTVVPICEPRRRYELANSRETTPDIGQPGDTFCEIETIPLSENRIDVRIAALDFGNGLFFEEFFTSIYDWFYTKWLPDRFVIEYEDLDGKLRSLITQEVDKPIEFRINHFKRKLKFPKNIDYEKELENPELEARRQELLAELKRRLPPIEEYEDDVSISSDPKGKAGMSDWRKRRAYLFKEVKNGDKSLTYQQVADRAKVVAFERIEKQLGEDFPTLTGEMLIMKRLDIFKRDYGHRKDEFYDTDVINDFRDMEWTWTDARKLE